ncbi:putative UDP-N-acetylglucosamine-peptide N-acetylglucosaminyltransferase 110 kDa subunit [Phytophthora cinnamomi]|uniref:putative UDP-N-acetylglucosamine-peptide N-acetylglucosaminyltransferase 110 kDa subunit n=1 Tax=Phytophthora cinnamomi TaxID=4785 RepID=UPI00355A4055|nr:putative UDP-N-acetylglucosamine-peptide N-acetylglucosaminyltransferase 110 kDa subunit [Phytophthora cinnamomi]
MAPPLACLALFLSLRCLIDPSEAATVLVVTPENEASLTLAAQLYRKAQDASELPDKERLFRESIDAYPELAPAYNNLAMLVLERHGRDEAVQLLERGLQAAEATNDRENVANIHNNLGFVTREYGKWSVAHSLAALRHFDAALEIDPEFTGALYNKASVFLALRRDMECKELLLKVLELEPDNRQAHLDLGRIYFEHGDLEKALQHEDRVIEMAMTTKQKLEGMHNKGVFLREYGFLARALDVYSQMLAIASVESYVLVDIMNAKRLFCDWRDMEALENQVVAAAQRQLDFEMPEEPVQFLPYDSTLLKLPDNFRKTLAMRASKQYEQPSTLELLPLPWRENEPTWDRPLTPQRLKVGYLSFDFRDHPMGHLTLGLIEQHAALARGVDTICYSYGPNSEASAPWRRQFEEKCGMFRDLLGMSDLEAAQAIGLDGIDVLVDLMAHTKGARLGIPSLRPSRITVNYLGYPGTMGSTFTDFAMVDKSVVPPEVATKTMSEQVVYLPHTYQANRYEVSIASCGADTECQRMNRSQHSLPTDAMVFCNFNTINKMETESFSVWMSILRQVPKSVLWLLAPSGEDAVRVMELLNEQAMAHGVLPSRIIFAPRVDKLSHLARVTVADLFLDSFIYNAHSTAADALWANVPIVTFWGDTFPSRVAASLIQKAIPFPELISHSVKDYERIAVHLAKTPSVLRHIRSLLASHSLTSPLFNTKQTTESIETAYEVMHDVVNRLHPFTKEDSSSRFQLIIHPEHTAKAFDNAEIAYARVDNALRQGISLQESGDYIGARHAYSRVLRATPGNPDVIHLLGTIFYQTGELERAVEYITRAVTANPHVSWYHSNLGVAYAALEKLDLAEAEFQLALQLDPANRIAISKLGELYTAQKAFDRVVELYATYGEAAYFFTGKTSASQEDIEKAYLDYFEALTKTGRSLDAIKLLEDAVQQHPTLFQLSYNLGVMYNEAERYDEGNQRQFATVLAQGRYLYETKGKHFKKIPRPEHKVVIAFYCHEYGQEWWEHWGPSSLDTGLGGSEEALVFLSRELQMLGYWVEIYGDPSPQDVSTLDQADQDVVRWYPHYTYDVDDRGVDMFVAWRYHISLAMGKTAWKKFLWMHDLPQEDAKRSTELLNNVDRIFCLSDFHASMFPERLQSKITVHTNAVDPSFFVDGPNHADRLVYGSSPSRGLYAVLQAWPRIREAIPTAELSVFYGFRPAFIKWGHSHMANFTVWMAEMDRLLTETPGVRYVGLVNHAQLAKEYSYAGFYLYPTTFSETSCISLMKAMVNGAIPITSRFPASALPETVDEFDLGPRALQQNSIVADSEWMELWIQSIVDAVRDEQQAFTIRHRMKRFARKKYRWEHIALQWHQVISKPRFP